MEATEPTIEARNRNRASAWRRARLIRLARWAGIEPRARLVESTNSSTASISSGGLARDCRFVPALPLGQALVAQWTVAHGFAAGNFWRLIGRERSLNLVEGLLRLALD